ncbi:hypothetical protein PV749_28590 [Streptomyces sp. ID03-2B]|nr:hypothetical protein [Streptomyces sp. ID03-2B]MDX3595091.1 hypothetical protein [Streptomyces sp. ID03-2B]
MPGFTVIVSGSTAPMPGFTMTVSGPTAPLPGSTAPPPYFTSP